MSNAVTKAICSLRDSWMVACSWIIFRRPHSPPLAPTSIQLSRKNQPLQRLSIAGAQMRAHRQGACAIVVCQSPLDHL